jgi:arylsulfatase A-like enzyme
LTHAWLDHRQQETLPPLVLPLDTSTRVHDATRSAIEKGALTIEGGPGAALAFDVDVAAHQYSAFEVRMSATAGTRCRLQWQGPVEPDAAAHPGVEVSLLADGQAHTYTLPLDATTSPGWRGSIESLRFLPSNESGVVRIEYAALVDSPDVRPERLTLERETREALALDRVAWNLAVPEAAVLDVAVAVHKDAWSAHLNPGARFTVALAGDTGAPVTLAERVVQPGASDEGGRWLSLQIDLAAYGGQQVRLDFTARPLGSAAGHYAYWGNPVVHSTATDSAATPVILLSIDTLRTHHLGSYGYSRDTSSHLDAFAEEAVLFENAFTQDAWTLPSHTTMLTGLYPKNHTVAMGNSLPESIDTLQDVLGGAGYLSAGWSGISAWFQPSYGHSRGFDFYEYPDGFRTITETQILAEKWISGHGAGNFFVFFHNYDVHSKSRLDGFTLPYEVALPGYAHFAKAFNPPPPLERPGQEKRLATDFLQNHNEGAIVVTREERDYLIALYDDGIRYVDEAIGDFFDTLRERGLYDKALIIVTSDHGETFGEHGLYLHGQAYDDQTRVPLIVRFPEGRFGGRRMSEIVELPDLFPTVLDVVGIDAPAPPDGQSLLALVEGGAEGQPYAYSERLSVHAVQSAEWKLMRDSGKGTWELYDLEGDPEEQINRYDDAHEMGAALEEEWNRFYATDPAGIHVDVTAGDTPSKITFRVQSPEPLGEALLLYGEKYIFPEKNDSMSVTPARRVVSGYFRAADGDHDELIIRDRGAAAIQVEVASETPFVFIRPNRSPVETTAISATMPLAEVTSPTPPSIAEDYDLPVVRIWFSRTPD